MRPGAPSNATNSQADELERFRRRVRGVLSLVFAAWLGFRFAMCVYSGPSAALALELIAAGAVVVWLCLAFLPDKLATALVYLLTFLR